MAAVGHHFYDACVPLLPPCAVVGIASSTSITGSILPPWLRTGKASWQLLQEFYQVSFRKKLYTSIEELQADLDAWLIFYNTVRTHQGKMCCGRTPMETLEDGKKLWQDKNLNQI